MKTIVIYHSPCYDGITAAYIAHDAADGNIELLPGTYGKPAPFERVLDRDVLVFDFSYSREDMLRMAEEAATFHVYDHHKTAREACMDLDFCTFDLSKSGARLAWEHFYDYQPMPRWIECVEDRDLWRFRLPETPHVRAFQESLPQTIEGCRTMATTALSVLVEGGRHIKRFQELQIADIARQGVVKEWHDPANPAWHGVPFVSIGNGQHVSDTCALALLVHQEAKFACAWFRVRDGKWVHSLRSRSPNVDVSNLAVAHGGGGHTESAGFTNEELIA